MSSSDRSAATARRSDWLVALVMTVSGAVPAGLIGWAGSWSVWSSMVAALSFWPFAFVGAALFTRRERNG